MPLVKQALRLERTLRFKANQIFNGVKDVLIQKPKPGNKLFVFVWKCAENTEKKEE